MTPATLIRAAVLVALIGCACAAGIQTLRLQELRTSIATERADRAEADRRRDRAITIAQQEADRHAAIRTAQTRVDIDRAAVAGDGLRQRTAQLRAVGAAAASECSDASAAIDLLTDVPERLEPAGRAIAEWADQLDTALETCQRDYRALIQP